MPAPRPLSVFEDVFDLVHGQTFGGGYFVDLKQEPWRTALLDAERAQKEDVADGSQLKAALYSLAGDFEKAHYWLRNIEANGAKVRALWARLDLSPLMGETMWAFANFDQVFEKCPTAGVGRFVNIAVAHGLFAKAVRLVDESRKAQIVTKLHNDIDMVRRVAGAMEKAGIEEETVARTVGATYDLMREQKLIWYGAQPLIAVMDQGGASEHVAIRYRLKVTPTVAAELSWELSERLAQANLLRDELVVSFAVARAAVGAEVDALAA